MLSLCLSQAPAITSWFEQLMLPYHFYSRVFMYSSTDVDSLPLSSLFKRGGPKHSVHLALLDVEASKKTVEILKNIVLDEGAS